MSDTRIADGMVVSLAYTLADAEGTLLDEATREDPMLYLHGHDNVVPGLERELTGKSVGDKVSAVVLPKDGYGEKRSRGAQPVPRDAFPEDAEIEPGMMFVTEERGEPVPLWVVRADDTTVWVETDHPLAGQELHFDVEVLAIRKGTAPELEHGHPHGPDGHSHHH
jgi:FKBP-type peptidyl-prolyl cis-trans isomerase SlyD